MLHVTENILELIAECAPLVRSIERRDKAQAAQIRNALNSLLLNTAEGGGQRGARQASHYSIAYGSGRECLVGLRASVVWGHVPQLSPALLDRFDHVLAVLWKVAHRT